LLDVTPRAQKEAAGETSGRALHLEEGQRNQLPPPPPPEPPPLEPAPPEPPPVPEPPAPLPLLVPPLVPPPPPLLLFEPGEVVSFTPPGLPLVLLGVLLFSQPETDPEHCEGLVAVCAVADPAKKILPPRRSALF
jgi:hypothetical protein